MAEITFIPIASGKKPNPNFVPPPTVGAKNARTGFAARWIPFWNSFLNEEEFRCSECDAKYQHTYDTCPWCGATMTPTRAKVKEEK